jgi:hypothetical protein
MLTVGQVGTGAAVEQLTTAASGESFDFALVFRFLLRFLS